MNKMTVYDTYLDDDGKSVTGGSRNGNPRGIYSRINSIEKVKP